MKFSLFNHFSDNYVPKACTSLYQEKCQKLESYIDNRSFPRCQPAIEYPCTRYKKDDSEPATTNGVASTTERSQTIENLLLDMFLLQSPTLLQDLVISNFLCQ